MIKSGWILVFAIAITPRAFAGAGATDPQRRCDDQLTSIGPLDPVVEATAYIDASLATPASSFAQAITNARFSTDPMVLALNQRGLHFELSSDGARVSLRSSLKELHRWTLDEPVAEVRFLAGESGRPDQLAMVGWLRTHYYELSHDGLTETLAPAAKLLPRPSYLALTPDVLNGLNLSFDEGRLTWDRAYADQMRERLDQLDVRVSPGIPNRLEREPSEDVVRLHRLARAPAAPSLLVQAVAEFTRHILARAHSLCEGGAIEGGVTARDYPNQMLALAADAIRAHPALRQTVAMSVNEDAGEVHVRVPPGQSKIDPTNATEVLEIALPGCLPLAVSIPEDPYTDARGWAALHAR